MRIGRTGAPSATDDDQAAERRASRDRAGDFAAFVGRNLAYAYRLSLLTLRDPVAAQDVVHDGLMAAWQVGGTWPPRAVDGAFARRLVAECRVALRGLAGPAAAAFPAGHDAGPEADELWRAVGDLEADDQLALAQRFGLGTLRGPVADVLATHRRPLEARLRAAREELCSSTGCSLETLDARLAALYEEIAPDDAPSELRWRLQRSLAEAGQAAAEQAEIAARSGWGFAVKAALGMLAIGLAITSASLYEIRSNQATVQTGAPLPPPTPTRIGPLETVAAFDSPHVLVAAAGSSLVVAYQVPGVWHVSPRNCQPDVLGLARPGGGAEWTGQLTGHLQALAGTTASDSAFAVGVGTYCELETFASTDGGQTWLARPLPASAPDAPAWLAVSPVDPLHLLALQGGAIYASGDGGRSWASRPATAWPVAIGPDGSLVGWRSGQLLGSHDDGRSWWTLSGGPVEQPIAATALADGVLTGGADGLWWFPSAGPALQLRGGRVFDVASVDGAGLAVGGDAAGPWLGLVHSGTLVEASLPDSVARLAPTSGRIGAVPDGLAAAFVGSRSAIVVAPISH